MKVLSILQEHRILRESFERYDEKIGLMVTGQLVREGPTEIGGAERES